MNKFFGIVLILFSLFLTIFIIIFGPLFFMSEYGIITLSGFIFIAFIIMNSGIILFRGRVFNKELLIKPLSISIIFLILMLIRTFFTKEVWHFIPFALLFSIILTFILFKIVSKITKKN